MLKSLAYYIFDRLVEPVVPRAWYQTHVKELEKVYADLAVVKESKLSLMARYNTLKEYNDMYRWENNELRKENEGLKKVIRQEGCTCDVEEGEAHRMSCSIMKWGQSTNG